MCLSECVHVCVCACMGASECVCIAIFVRAGLSFRPSE